MTSKKAAMKPVAAPVEDLSAVIASLSAMGGGEEERENEFLAKVGSAFIGWLDAKQEKKLRAAYKRADDVLEKTGDLAASDAAFSTDMLNILTKR